MLVPVSEVRRVPSPNLAWRRILFFLLTFFEEGVFGSIVQRAELRMQNFAFQKGIVLTRQFDMLPQVFDFSPVTNKIAISSQVIDVKKFTNKTCRRRKYLISSHLPLFFVIFRPFLTRKGIDFSPLTQKAGDFFSQESPGFSQVLYGQGRCVFGG
jgi:hypothetical protein